MAANLPFDLTAIATVVQRDGAARVTGGVYERKDLHNIHDLRDAVSTEEKLVAGRHKLVLCTPWDDVINTDLVGLYKLFEAGSPAGEDGSPATAYPTELVDGRLLPIVVVKVSEVAVEEDKVDVESTKKDSVIVHIRIGVRNTASGVDGSDPTVAVAVAEVDLSDESVMYRKVDTLQFNGLSLGNCERGDAIDHPTLLAEYTLDDWSAVVNYAHKADLDAVLIALAGRPSDDDTVVFNGCTISPKARPIVACLSPDLDVPNFTSSTSSRGVSGLVVLYDSFSSSSVQFLFTDGTGDKTLYTGLHLSHVETLEEFKHRLLYSYVPIPGYELSVKEHLDGLLMPGWELVVWCLPQVEACEVMVRWDDVDQWAANDWLDKNLEKRPNNVRQLYFEVFVQGKPIAEQKAPKKRRRGKERKSGRRGGSGRVAKADRAAGSGREDGGRQDGKSEAADQTVSTPGRNRATRNNNRADIVEPADWSAVPERALPIRAASTVQQEGEEADGEEEDSDSFMTLSGDGRLSASQLGKRRAGDATGPEAKRIKVADALRSFRSGVL